IQQVVTRDEKWVPFTKRVKISSTNVRLETTVPQKEETFQVVIDLIKNSSCFKAFTISTDAQRSLYSSSGKMSRRTILDICPRVKGVNFTNVADDDTTLAFLIKLGYKGPLYKHTNMFMDYMHQPWRALAAIINKKEKRSRCENMPFPRFTKVIINYFLKQHNSLSNLKYQHNHTIKDDGIISRLKFVKIGEDYQEYRLLIPETMLTEAIKQFKSYQMFIKYITHQIPPKKSIGKWSQRKKTTDTHVADVDVSEESDPKSPKRKTTSRRVVKKKVIITANDKIIPDDPDIVLELGKSISKTKAKKEEAARQVHATHAKSVTKYVPEPIRRRKSGKVTFDPPKRLKGIRSLTPEEQEATDTLQAQKESRNTSKRQHGTRGSNEGTSTIPGVLEDSTVISATSSEGTEDQLNDKGKDDRHGHVDDEGNDHVSDTQDDDDDEDAETEFDLRVAKLEKDVSALKKIDLSVKALVALKIQVPSVVDNYLGFKVGDHENDEDDDEDPPARPNYGKKTKRRRTKKLESSKKPSTTKEIPKGKASSKGSKTDPTAEVVMDDVGEDVVRDDDQPEDTSEPKLAKTLNLEYKLDWNNPEGDRYPFDLRVAKLEKDVSALKKIDLSVKALAALKIQVPSVVDNYLGFKVGDVFQKELKKHTTYLT
nr:hypothetical protein [Tanacetum cinerariifolium]